MSLLYIVDGYNVIKSGPLGDLPLRQARERFFSFLETSRPHGSVRNRLIVVFDGSSEVFGFKDQTSFEVVFTSGESADEKIKSLVGDLPDTRSVIVVTDDRDLSYSVRRCGAQVMGTKDFLNKPRHKGQGRSRRAAGEADAGNTLNLVQRERITEEFRKLWLDQ